MRRVIDCVVDMFLGLVCIVCLIPWMLWAAVYPRLNHNGWSPLFFFAPFTFDKFGEDKFVEEGVQQAALDRGDTQ